MPAAVVIGSGPNGLTAAAVLAREGFEVTVYEAEPTIGGAARSDVFHGTVMDRFSTGHPLASISPAFADLGLQIPWAHAAVDVAHPLGDAVGTLADVPNCGPEVIATFLRPPIDVAARPVSALRWGPGFMLPAAITARALGRVGGAVFAGVAAHSIVPQHLPLTSAIGYLLSGARPWTVPVGGSQVIADALVTVLTEHGGTVITDTPITELPAADVVLFDTGLGAARDLLGQRAPRWLRRRRWRNGPGAFKVDLVVQEGIPWRDHLICRAAFVHLGGTAGEIAAKESMVNRGAMPSRPVAIVSQQYVADPTRVAGTAVPVSVYVHCPNGFPGDLTESTIAEIERHAPGVRDRIVATRSVGPRELESSNANLVGGDIAAGAAGPMQILRRPTLINPYRLTERAYLCSAAASPGPGVHGMAGWHAAHRVLADFS